MTEGKKLPKKKQDFESDMKRLEEIVAILEKGEEPLDDSIKLFEEGMEKAKSMKKYLDEAKRKIEIITKEAGLFKVSDFDETH